MNPKSKIQNRYPHARIAPSRRIPYTEGSRKRIPTSVSGRPHRLEAQDTGFSRRQRGFESRWGQYLCFESNCRYWQLVANPCVLFDL